MLPKRLDRSKTIRNGKLNMRSLKSLPIPWFIFGFLMMSALNTLQVIPSGLTNLIILAAYMLIAMAMAGLGLSVEIVTFRQLGLKAFAAGFIGSIVLSLIGYVFLKLFNLG